MSSPMRSLRTWAELKFILAEMRFNRILIVPHENADIDAVASSILLKILLQHLFRNIEINIVVPSMKLNTRKFLKYFPLETISSQNVKLEDKFQDKQYIVILVDLSDARRFLDPKIKNIIISSSAILAIDHHETLSPLADYVLYMPASSTTEIILHAIEEEQLWNYVLRDETLRKIAISAILADTAFLNHISEKTFYYLHKLIYEPTPNPQLYTHVKKLLLTISSEKPDLSETIAIIKALQRSIILKHNDKIAVITHVSSYETKVANYLIKLNIPIVIVVSPKKGRHKRFIRIILRSKTTSLKDLTISISKLFKQSSVGFLNEYTATIQAETNLKTQVLIQKIRKILENLIIHQPMESIKN